MIGDSAQSIRLPGTEQRYPVADTFPVTHELAGAQVKRGQSRPTYSYTVILLKDADENHLLQRK